ncbi:hypothetical protein ACIRG5_42415 [Lentzea sp. NPDC102401]|uniref:hypothetical protein n=1 Tax=Lentzea sp. NPDC102401 TaxID=3364128 RepID=UPI003801A2A7
MTAVLDHTPAPIPARATTSTPVCTRWSLPVASGEPTACPLTGTDSCPSSQALIDTCKEC